MAANCFFCQIANFHANSDILAKSVGGVNQKLNVNHSSPTNEKWVKLNIAIIIISYFSESSRA